MTANLRIMNSHVAEEKENDILTYLRRKRSLPFLELASLVDLDNSSLREIVSKLEQAGLVTVKNPYTLVDEIVSIKYDSFRPAF